MQMSDKTNDFNRRKVLQKAGFGVVGSSLALSSVGAAQSAGANEGENKLSEEEKEAVLKELEEIAEEELNECLKNNTDGDLSTKATIPKWVPGLPDGLPFNWCLNVPFGPEMCALAEAPIMEESLSCGGNYFTGRSVGMSFGYGPNIDIEDDDITGNIQNEISFSLLIDESNGCIYVETGVGFDTACLGPNCPDYPDLSDVSVTELANTLYDTSRDLAEDIFDAAGLNPPEIIIIAAAILIAVAGSLITLKPPTLVPA
ncbi:hypothetical protein [Halostagnicola kamekurae]|uniref:Uncharacterized protein n=1 Tax=Halostagnicola kamekurae TaxID=619731 RepID=A0A1I6P3Z0_9EURY|nr:hypothetical protein [Halostagnicola kamekurae]SFS34924.1 hypothetical protein SAMN04488556_0307 [Halostagnicola kamekurae]